MVTNETEQLMRKTPAKKQRGETWAVRTVCVDCEETVVQYKIEGVPFLGRLRRCAHCALRRWRRFVATMRKHQVPKALWSEYLTGEMVKVRREREV